MKGGYTMQSDTVMLYKLIILFMLDKVDFPLTNAHISNFMLDKDYTDYFTIQQVISELVDAEFIKTEMIRHNSRYQITESGRETLSFFENKISAAIQNDIKLYLQENKFRLRNETSVTSDFIEEKKGEYLVTLKVKEKNSTIIELNLTVPTEEEATKICANWSSKSQDIYAMVFSSLLS